MCTKIIFFIATLYVVKASVISLNAYDGDGSLADGIVDNEVEEYDTSLNKALVEDPEAEIAEVSSDPKDLSEKRRCSPRRCNELSTADEILDDLFEKSDLNVDEVEGVSSNNESELKLDEEIEAEKSFADDISDILVEESNLNTDKVEDVAFSNEAKESELNLDEEVEDTEAMIAAFFSDPRDLFEIRRCFPRLCNRLCRLKRFDNGICVQGRCKCENIVQEYTTTDATTE
ncbi:unnamed protein product [Arctia plantaginis]|uniref:Uncharacterized protein n=1 Tax=Arctia plantaginis TaxID=874455 RepID=A0A8S0Z9W6_ARCPL|nr:unnamed protein product [Arctia plantaginis]